MKPPYSLGFALSLSLLCVTAFAVERQQSKQQAGSDQAGSDLAPPLELFQAVDASQIEVQFIPLDATRANILIENKTDRILQIALPEAFAAVPVLAQLGQQFGQAGGGQAAGGQAGGGAQGVGGGMNAGGNQGFGNGQGGGGRQGMNFGVLRIPPEKTRKLTATTVCLEHGKTEPNPRLAYRMIPIDQFSDDQRIAVLCKQLGQGEIRQNTAQAVAWHLANHLTWVELASINRIESRYLGNLKFFQTSELDQAKEYVAKMKAETETYAIVQTQE